MAHQHKARGQRDAYSKRFQARYGMSRAEFRQLRVIDPVAAHKKRMLADRRRIHNV